MYICASDTLVMEETQVRPRDDNTVSVCCLNASIIHDASPWRSNVADPASRRTVHVVREGEEGIRGDSDALERVCVRLSLFLAERLRDRLECRLPFLSLLRSRHLFAIHNALDEEVDGVALLWALCALLEGETEDTRVLPQPPVVRLAARQSRAVDPALLTRAQADVVLLDNRLNGVELLFTTAHRGRRILRQNLGWALGYNLVSLPLAAAGLVPPWLAALGMSLSSLLVILNALRLSSPSDDHSPAPENLPQANAALEGVNHG